MTLTTRLKVAGNLAMLAARNVRRNRARSALTLGALLFGVAATIVLSSFGNGLVTLMIDDVVFAKGGGIQVHRAGWSAADGTEPLDLDLPADGGALARIRGVPGVVAAAPRIVFSGLISNGQEGTMFIGRGLAPDAEYQALPWATRDIQGKPIADDAPHRGVVGGDLARALDVKPGTGLVTLQVTTQAGRQNAQDLDVGAVMDNATAFESKRFVHVPLSYAQGLLGMPGKANEVVVRVADREAIPAVAAALREALGADYEVETWQQIQPNLADMVMFQRVVVGIISFVFLVIVVFGVANTMVMSVLERTNEIGTMMAVGLRRGNIAVMFLFEASVLAVTGAVLGTALARAVIAIMTAAGGFPVAAPGETVARYALMPMVPAGMVTTAVTASIVGALLASVYPTWKAARLRPVEALRSV